MSTPTIYLPQSSNTTLITTELNALAASGYFTSSVNGSSGVFCNIASGTLQGVSATSNFGGYLRALLTMTLANPSAAFAANGVLGLWWLHSIDGSNYEVASASNPRAFDVTIPIPAVVTQVPVTMDVKFPPGIFKVGGQYVPGSGTQAFAASGSTLVIQPYTLGQ